MRSFRGALLVFGMLVYRPRKLKVFERGFESGMKPGREENTYVVEAE